MPVITGKAYLECDWLVKLQRSRGEWHSTCKHPLTKQVYKGPYSIVKRMREFVMQESDSKYVYRILNSILNPHKLCITTITTPRVTTYIFNGKKQANKHPNKENPKHTGYKKLKQKLLSSNLMKRMETRLSKMNLQMKQKYKIPVVTFYSYN